MGVEENPITSSAADQRWDLINSILEKRVSFPDEPFYARSITSRVYVAKHSVWGRKYMLTPVAFRPSVFAIVTGASPDETIQPYLYATLDRRLVYTRERRFYFVRDPLLLSDDDIDRLRLGVQGDSHLITHEAERDGQRVLYALSFGINIPF